MENYIQYNQIVYLVYEKHDKHLILHVTKLTTNSCYYIFL